MVFCDSLMGSDPSVALSADTPVVTPCSPPSDNSPLLSSYWLESCARVAKTQDAHLQARNGASARRRVAKFANLWQSKPSDTSQPIEFYPNYHQFRHLKSLRATGGYLLWQ